MQTLNNAMALAQKIDEASSLPDVRTVTIDKSKGHLGVTLGNTESGNGVLILEVHPADLFAKAGLKKGYVILTVDGKTVDNHGDAFAAFNDGSTLTLEYWNDEEAKTAASLQKTTGGGVQSLGGGVIAMLVVFALVIAGTIGGGAYIYANGGVDAVFNISGNYTAPVDMDMEAAPSPPPPRKSKAREIIEDWGEESGTLEDYEERLEELTRDELIKVLKRKDKTWQPTEAHTAEWLRSQMVSQAAQARQKKKEMEEEMGITQEERDKKKIKKQLKLKDASQLKEMLNDVGVYYPEDATVKELRRIALEEEAMAKWDALDEKVKLEKNRKRAVEAAERATAAAALRKQKEADSREFGEGQVEMENAMKEAKRRQKNKWERDWDQSDEDEARERLNKLTQYKNMDPEGLESVLESIRGDKSLLDGFEQEERLNREMKEATLEGRRLTLGDMKRMGASVTSFEKGRSLDSIVMDASGAFK